MSRIGSSSQEIKALSQELEAKHGSRFSRQVVVEELDVHPETVMRWGREGRIGCLRHGPRSVKVEASTLAEFIVESRVGANRPIFGKEVA